MCCEFWRHLPQLSLKVALFTLVVISPPWLSEAAVEFLHKKTELSEQSGDDGSETNLKFLKQQRALGVEIKGPCPVMRGRVSVSLSGACVHWAPLFWMEARIDAGFIFTGQIPVQAHQIHSWVFLSTYTVFYPQLGTAIERKPAFNLYRFTHSNLFMVMWIVQGQAKIITHPLSNFITDDSHIQSQAYFCVDCCPLFTSQQLYRDTYRTPPQKNHL